ncbi:unnamed protein product [Dicrocoelium dendriticum]|nr:unnamed protein product [Dicrocoelium dendriticum]
MGARARPGFAFGRDARAGGFGSGAGRRGRRSPSRGGGQSGGRSPGGGRAVAARESLEGGAGMRGGGGGNTKRGGRGARSGNRARRRGGASHTIIERAPVHKRPLTASSLIPLSRLTPLPAAPAQHLSDSTRFAFPSLAFAQAPSPYPLFCTHSPSKCRRVNNVTPPAKPVQSAPTVPTSARSQTRRSDQPLHDPSVPLHISPFHPVRFFTWRQVLLPALANTDPNRSTPNRASAKLASLHPFRESPYVGITSTPHLSEV